MANFDAEHILQSLHDSEINWRINCFWDSCWSAYLGDEMNGYSAENHNLESFSDCVAWLAETACRHYPNSDFAKNNSAGIPA